MKSNDRIMKIFLIFLLSSYFKPIGIAMYPELNRAFQIFKIFNLIISILLIVYLTKLQITCKKNMRGFVGFIIFEIIYILNSLLNRENCQDLLNNCFTNLILFVLIYCFSNSGYKKIFLNALNNLFTIEIILHVCSFITAEINYPIFEVVEGIEGIENTYLFGRDNYSAFIILPMLGIVLYTDMVLKNSLITMIKGYVLCSVLFVMYLHVNSATASIAFFMMLCFLFFKRLGRKILKIINLKILIVLVILFLIGIIKFDIQNYFSEMLSILFNKGVRGSSLNSRTIIWLFAWELIKEKPILGWGILSEEQISNYVLYGAAHSHNLILEILIRTGIIGLISYLLFLLWPCRKMSDILQSKAYVLIFTIFCYLILSTMDSYPLIQIQYCLFALLYCWREYEIVH